MNIISLVCKGCKESFIAKYKYMKYCHKTFQKKCSNCGDLFSLECKPNMPTTCSVYCARAKAVGKFTVKRFKISCLRCHQDFAGSIDSKFCYEDREASCQICCKVFLRKCARDSVLVKTCSPDCSLKLALQKKRKLVKRICICCDSSFTGTSRQNYCGRTKNKTCLTCNTVFPQKCSIQERSYCTSVCAGWSIRGTNFDFTKLEEFKDISRWALTFKKERKRKPTRSDFHAYFGVAIPSDVDKRLFKSARTSRWEQMVYQHIEVAYPDLKIETLRKFTKDGKKLEIDILLPELSLGFEVQDFASHSRTNDCEVGKWGVKRGPSYHDGKRRFFASLNISIVEVWEDELLNGEFSSIVDSAIKRETRKLTSPPSYIVRLQEDS